MTEYRFLNPYNFVRSLKQSDCPNFGRQAPPDHSIYHKDRLTGHLACTLKVITPLFISNGQAERLDANGHPTYKFFEIDGNPFIPASSLRGMLRGVYETVTNSCYSVFDDVRLSRRMLSGEGQDLTPGVVMKTEDGFALRLFLGKQREGSRSMQKAAWVKAYRPGRRGMLSNPRLRLEDYRHGDRCWATMRPTKYERGGRVIFWKWQVEELFKSEKDATAAANPSSNIIVEEGYLCITGQNTERKHDERFFFGESGYPIPIPTQVCQDYNAVVAEYRQRHDEVRRRQSQPGERPAALSDFIFENDSLGEGSLVYAALNGRSINFLVPVQLSRRLFPNSTGELLGSDHLRMCESLDQLCPACRLFGWVHAKKDSSGSEATAYAGRVRVSYGYLDKSTRREKAYTLAELSSPKPTATFFYLRKKDGSNEFISKADGYNKRTQVLRGRKYYRHHGDFKWRTGRPTSRNRTIVDAVSPGGKSQFVIWFTNLTSFELGALAWSVQLESGMHHRLGYGKPLGLGSVKISIDKANVFQMDKRYSSFTEQCSHPVDIPELIAEFKLAAREAYGKNFESLENIIDLRSVLSAHPVRSIHYPSPDLEDHGSRGNESFRWFMESQRRHDRTRPGLPSQGSALGLAHEDRGLGTMGGREGRR